ncbi:MULTISPECIES: DUF6801 domain-containing protein [unclassified Nocardioides]|uniref:DUF6801 domain-containing protein n=1 Tax=unclassified Nocardioides TaxID=2615069 RepID=UPI00361B1B4C
MTLRHRHFRTIAAGSVLGLAAGATAVVGTATSASAVPISFDCTVPVLGANTFPTNVTTNAPSQIGTGQSFTPSTKAVLTIPDGLADTMRSLLGTTEIGGTIQSLSTVNGAPAPVTLTIPRTPVPADGDVPLTGTGTGAPITAGPAGGTIDIAAGAQTVVMSLFNAGGTESPFEIPCTPASGSNLLVSRTAITATPTTPQPPAPPATKAASTTVAKAKYQARTDKVRARAAVSLSPKSAASGTIKFALKRGKKVVKAKAVGLTNSRASYTFKRVRKPGKYTLTATYQGATDAKRSTDKVTFRVR